jgi:peptide/nickel transport system substrate-binding protein
VVERKAQTIRDIRINTAKGALKSRLVRQALSYAYDYNGIVQGVFQGHAARMRGVGPTGFKNFVPEPHLYTFNLKKARALLKQSGYSSKDLNFQIAYLPEDTQSIQMAQIYQSDLAKIGVKATLQGIPIGTYVRIDTKPSTNPDIWFGNWTMDYADDAQLYWTDYYSGNVPSNGGGNVFYYKDPLTDRFLMAGVRAKSAGAAYRNFARACHRIYNAAVEIWAAQPTERVALRKNVHGYTYNYLYSAFYYPLYDMYRS